MEAAFEHMRRDRMDMMKKTLLFRQIVLLLTILTLSGCILVPVDDGYQHGGQRGGHQGDHHDGPRDHR